MNIDKKLRNYSLLKSAFIRVHHSFNSFEVLFYYLESRESLSAN